MAAPASLTELLLRLFLTGCLAQDAHVSLPQFQLWHNKKKHFRVLAVKSGNLLLRKPKCLS